MAWMLNAIYLMVLVLASPWLLWRSYKTGRYREGFREKFFGSAPLRTTSNQCLWIHAVSVGEVQLVRPLIERWRERHPDWEVVLSVSTVTGMNLARTSFAGITSFYSPLDFSWSVKRAIKRVKPSMLVLAELELWPNLISSCHRNNVPVVIVNGRLSEKSFRGYQRIRSLVARLLGKISLIAAQDETYAVRFKTLGADANRVITTGSVKFDGAQSDRQHPSIMQLRELVGLEDGVPVWMAGSTQAPEEQMVLDLFLKVRDRIKDLHLVVIPRHQERFAEVASILDREGIKFVRRSQLKGAISAADWNVLLIDTIGELRWWWGMADLALVGGSFGNRGGQNMLEPSAYGASVAFGPNTKNFREIVGQLLKGEAATELRDAADLEEWVISHFEDRELARAYGERARTLIARHRGATERTLQAIESVLHSSSNSMPKAVASTLGRKVA